MMLRYQQSKLIEFLIGLEMKQLWSLLPSMQSKLPKNMRVMYGLRSVCGVCELDAAIAVRQTRIRILAIETPSKKEAFLKDQKYKRNILKESQRTREESMNDLRI